MKCKAVGSKEGGRRALLIVSPRFPKHSTGPNC